MNLQLPQSPQLPRFATHVRAGRWPRRIATAVLATVALAAVLSPAVLDAGTVRAQKGQSPAASTPSGGAIQGYVYFDADGDGAFGPAESAVAGVPIRLVGAEGSDTAATDVQGLYRFTGLAAGAYDVAVDTTALAVVLGSTEGLDVPGYDALRVADETLSGVNFALDAQQVGRLAAALAKAVAAVQAALPGGRPGVAATDAVTATDALTDAGATGVANAAAALTATTSATATTAASTTEATTATVRGATKGGRQMSEVATAMTTTARAAPASATAAARAGTAMTATGGAGDETDRGAGGRMDNAEAVAESAPGALSAMPGGGLADLFGPGALALLAGALSVLGGVGALRRRR